jgi:drug/metabolite transporter (DMT)-like permease
MMKLTGASETPKYEIMGLGAFGGMAIIVAFTALRGKMKRLRPQRLDRLLALGLFYLINYVLTLKALPALPLANFYTVIFLAPLIVTIFASYVLKEHLSWRHGVAIAVGFIGVVIATNPIALFIHHGAWKSYGIVFVVMLLLAMQMVSLRMLANRESRECTSFYPRIVAFSGSVIAVILWGFRMPSYDVVFYALLSGASGGVGWLCMAHSYTLAPAATVAPVHYSQIISGAFLGYLIWHDIPNPHTIIGAGIIIASGLYLVRHIRKSAKTADALAGTP